jgi:hypothetical protein
MKIESINDDMYEKDRDDNALDRLERLTSLMNLKEYIKINSEKINRLFSQREI